MEPSALAISRTTRYAVGQSWPPPPCAAGPRRVTRPESFSSWTSAYGVAPALSRAAASVARTPATSAARPIQPAGSVGRVRVCQSVRVAVLMGVPFEAWVRVA
ncbi:hypothetical protein GCM10009579_75000 [Streptomyces javensis]|uniref:Uncharacterized protein n=1 Tax=Streptomyces javensis TaxID=114698 RepID=A0ABN1XB26_9ACTN